MVKSEFPVSVQKNCEILSIQPESQEGHYAVTAKFTNQTNECVTPLHVKGTPESIGQILKCLGEKFATHEVEEDDLDNPLLERVVFEIKGKKVVAQNQDNGEEVLNADAPEVDTDKIEEISSRFLRPNAPVAKKEAGAEAPVLDSVPKVKKLWAETNANRKLTKEGRIKQKISDLHAFVRHLAEKKGIPQDKIDAAVDDLSGSNKNLNEVLNSYRLQHFPELESELKELQDCEECLKHFSIGS
ncbi:MAG: hypothetical protein JSR39_10205 [Verrucomicrobia bacterium]|nr:hypothetical protein [Verrucomicrobiota bacterium]